MKTILPLLTTTPSTRLMNVAHVEATTQLPAFETAFTSQPKVLFNVNNLQFAQQKPRSTTAQIRTIPASEPTTSAQVPAQEEPTENAQVHTPEENIPTEQQPRSAQEIAQDIMKKCAQVSRPPSPNENELVLSTSTLEKNDTPSASVSSDENTAMIERMKAALHYAKVITPQSAVLTERHDNEDQITTAPNLVSEESNSPLRTEVHSPMTTSPERTVDPHTTPTDLSGRQDAESHRGNDEEEEL